MRRSTSLGACFANLVLLAANVQCAPELAFPVNAQVPPVAYASQPFSYTFSETTFQSSKPPISYRIENAPAWLSLGTNDRTLQGSPGLPDVGAVTFQLQASDEDGTTSTDVTLVVSAENPIGDGESVAASLRSAGQVQGPSSLVLEPLAPFTIQFSKAIFSGTSSSTTYYATCSDDSPLPPWASFDAQAMRFSGTSPSIVNSSLQRQTYSFKIVASNVPGFTEASTAFDIVVSNSMFFFQSTAVTVNVTSGEDFQSEPFRDSLYLNGQPIDPTDLLSVQGSELPDWVNLDTETISLSGMVPLNISNLTLSLTAQDRFGDEAFLDVVLQPSSLPTTRNLLNITIKPGEYLNFHLPQSITQDATSITANTSDTTSWVAFSDRNMTLHGQVPEDLEAKTLRLSLIVTEGGSDIIYSVDLIVDAAGGPSASTSSDLSGGPASETGSTAADESNSHVRPRHILAIVLTTVLTVLAVLAIILLCLCLRKRKNKAIQEKEKIKDDQRALSNSDGSSVTPGGEAAVAKGSSIATARGASTRTPDQPNNAGNSPTIELPWAPDSLKKARIRFSRILQPQPQPEGPFNSDMPGLVPTRERGSRSPTLTGEPASGNLLSLPVDSPAAAPVYSQGRRRSEAERRQSARLAQIQRRRLSRDPLGNNPSRALSVHSPGLPNRLSSAAGVGHGSAILSPTSPDGDIPWRNSRMPTRASWTTTFSSINGKENRRPSVAITTLDQFPIPPAASSRSIGAHNEQDPSDTVCSYAGLTDTRPSLAQSGTNPVLRLVSSSPSKGLGATLPNDSESFSSRLQQYHTSRARADLEALSHFSNASLRTPSLSQFIPGTMGFRGPSSNLGHTGTGADDGELGPSARSVRSSPPRPPTRGNPSSNWEKWPLTSHAEGTMRTSRAPPILSPQPQRSAPKPYHLSRAVSASSGQFSSALSSSSASQWEDYEPYLGSPREMRSPPVSRGDWGYAYAFRGMSAENATDEMLYEMGLDERGERQWTTATSSAANSAVASPRLPFDGGRETTGDEGETEMGSESEGYVGVAVASRQPSAMGVGGLRLVDRRQRVISVDGKRAGHSDEESREGGGQASRETGQGSGTTRAWGGRERSRRGSLRFI